MAQHLSQSYGCEYAHYVSQSRGFEHAVLSTDWLTMPSNQTALKVLTFTAINFTHTTANHIDFTPTTANNINFKKQPITVQFNSTAANYETVFITKKIKK